ncbi:MAG: DUF1266 domain-containing protein [Lachnospirales bacterium]
MIKKFIISLLLLIPLVSCGEIENEISSPLTNWINATNGLYIYSNEGNFIYYGGIEKNNSNRKKAINFLEENYNINNQIDTVSMVNTLKAGYTNESFKNEYIYYTDFANNKVIENEEKYNFVIDTYELNGENALIGFDLGRANMLIFYSYIADYISLNQAIQYSVDICDLIQSNFENWSQYNESYLNGVYYLCEDTADFKIYEEYKAKEEDVLNLENTPYLVEFDLDLEKSYEDFLNK